MLAVVDSEPEYLDRGTDRLGLHVYPQTDGPAVVAWPAMGTPARFYRHFASDLHAAGLTVVVADLRGTGSSTPPPSRASRYGYADLVDDVAAVQTALRPRLDGRRTILLGHSLGGQMCALHVATETKAAGVIDVDGLVLVATGLPYWRAYPRRRRLAVLSYTQWIAATAALLRVWPGWGFGGRQARNVIRDWAYTARHGAYPLLAGVDLETALADVHTPVLAVSVEGDQYTPATTVDHLCAKLSGAPLERAHYTVEESGAPLDHFRWTRAAAPLARRVADFAKSL
jgi:predicted alpha/beta hydrolase